MKIATLWFSFVLTLASTAAAQNVVIPANHTELFNGTNFEGWRFCMSGQADPTKTWSITNGFIHCTGKPVGYLRSTQSYRHCVVTVVWRFVKLTPQADNTGVLVYIQSPDKVWPECVQVQGKHGHQGDIFLMAGAESKEHKGMDANTPLPKHGPSAEKPVGKWNTCNVVCSGNDVKAYVNGKFMNETTDCTVSSGFIGIQSEGAEIEIRKVALNPLR